MTNAAPAASEPIAAPETPVSEAPAQIERSEAPEAGERSAKVPSAREALQKAFAAVEQDDAKPTEPVKATSERPRNPDGTFAPLAGEQAPKAQETPADATQTQTATKTLDTPPARFSPDAKAAWAQAPEAIRGEINRAITELENGLTQKSEALKTYADLEPYAQRAQQQGTNLKAVIDNYLGWEARLAQDPANGFVSLLQNMGQDPLSFAQSILERAGIMPNDPSGQSQIYQQQIASQSQELQGLRGQVAQMQQFIEQMQIQQANQQIAEIARDKPGFDNLRPLMGQLIQSGMAQNLDEAYTMAARLKPEAIASVTPQPAPVVEQPAPAQVAQPAPAAQTRKASLSVTGAPSSGSNPANRRAPASAREAIQRAFASTGIA